MASEHTKASVGRLSRAAGRNFNPISRATTGTLRINDRTHSKLKHIVILWSRWKSTDTARPVSAFLQIASFNQGWDDN